MALMKVVGRIRSFLLEDLWTADLGSLSAPRRFLYLVLRAVALALRGFHQHRAPIWASSLTYMSLLSLVPFLGLVVMLGTIFGVSGRLVNTLVNQIPPNQLEVLDNAVTTMEHMDFRAIGAVALVLLLFAVVRTMTRVENAFNEVWGVSHGRSFGRRMVNYLFVAVAAPLFVLAAMGLSAAVLSSRFVGELESLPVGGWVMDVALVLVPYLAMLLALTLMFWLMPNTRVRLRAALLGAFVAAVLWMVLQKAYFAAQVELAGFGAVYGAFAALPMFLIWVYFSWLVVLFGGEIAYGAQHASAYAFERGEVKLSQESAERTALRIGMLMAVQFEESEKPLDSDEISLRLGIPARLTNRILSVLVNQRLVSNIVGGGYQIARSPSRITAADIVRGLRVDGEALPATVDVPEGSLERIDRLRNESLRVMQTTLADMVSGTSLPGRLGEDPCEDGVSEQGRSAP